jgi:hypothetical protein
MTRPSFFSGTLPRRLLAVGAAAGLAVTLLPAAPAEAASSQRVRATFFGMHDANPTSWPVAPVGNIRLWDSGVAWRQIETANGVFDFSNLDAQVDAARAHGARVLLVLGQTPRFHSTRPGKRGTYGLGAASMPTQSSWTNYVYKLVNRYKGRGVDYQVWNEANVSGYWNGTPAQMAKLTHWTSRIVNNNDASAQVVAPALATRLTGQRAWLRTFYAQRTGGKKVAAYVDAVSLNLYPLPKQAPEASMTLLNASRIMLSRAGVRKPIWNTEINYGLPGGGSATNITRAKEAAYVARTLVLNAENNIKRVFWYAWDLQNLANTQLTYTNGTSLTPAGKAYQVVRGWLLAGRTKGCARDGRGTYTCTLAYSGGVKRIYWNPSRKVTVRAVKSARASVGLYGVEKPLSGGEAIGVGSAPVMGRSAK